MSPSLSVKMLCVHVCVRAQAVSEWATAGNRIMAFVSGGILAQSQQNLAGIKLRNLKQHVCDLKLLGFAVTSNPLSPDSRLVMAELQDRWVSIKLGCCRSCAFPGIYYGVNRFCVLSVLLQLYSIYWCRVV